MTHDTRGTAGDAALFDRLMARVRAGGGGFGHREHVHLTWLAVHRVGMPAALSLVGDGIRRTATATGAPGKYHATLTRAWVELVAHHAGGREPAGGTDGTDGTEGTDGADRLDFAAFADRHAELFDKDLLDRHYRPGTLASPRARAEWVEPDLAPLPRPADR
ncbi:hypothetical protein ABT093_06310 [Kitasatospora sp. NPDC002551]|uniref:hypothetical protein n=1 Tax=Kitasatospora sp. NPDC002551 TaxID=3154539 RepID=UPI003324C6F1